MATVSDPDLGVSTQRRVTLPQYLLALGLRREDAQGGELELRLYELSGDALLADDKAYDAADGTSSEEQHTQEHESEGEWRDLLFVQFCQLIEVGHLVTVARLP